MKVYGLYIAFVLSMLTASPPSMGAQQSICDTVLLQRTSLSISQDSRFFGSWLTLVTEKNYDEAKHSASGTAFERFFTGDYADFSGKRREYLSQQSVTIDQADARAEVRVELPQEAVPAWRDCVLRDASDFFYWLDAVGSHSATLGIAGNQEGVSAT
jgi:hypothetical protein